MKSDRIYRNSGNPPLIDLLDEDSTRILDVGCGTGDNAALVKSRNSLCSVYGVTHSGTEADLARQHMASCWILDVEGELPADLKKERFDAIIFSHVLEHLRNPAEVLCKFSHLLEDGGIVLIAVPNVLSWNMRFQFLRGDFEYKPSGVLDDTHLRFFTYFTAERYLLSESANLKLIFRGVTGSVPLWWLRRHIFPEHWSAYIDRTGCRYWPNLFGSQVLLKAEKRESRDW